MKIPLFVFPLLWSFQSSYTRYVPDAYDPSIPDSEDKTLHRRRRPCGRDASQEQGRTFFDWSLAFLNVNNNYGSSVNCGNGQSGHGPLFSGNGNRPPGGLFGSHPQGGVLGGLQQTNSGSHNNGLFGLGLFNGLLGGGTNRPSDKPVSETPTQTNDHTSLNEEYDDVLPDQFHKLPPGQYVAASNSHLGTYVTGFNANKAIKEFDRHLDRFLKPLYDLFR